MRLTRRRFFGKTVSMGAGLTALRIFGSSSIFAAISDVPSKLDGKEERMAFTPATAYKPYESKPARKANEIIWIQEDLGSSKLIEAVKLYPAFELVSDHFRGYGFPARFKIEASDDPEFKTAHIIADRRGADCPNPDDEITEYPAHNIRGRYIRVTATQLRLRKPDVYYFALSKIDVLSEGTDIAMGRPVTGDSVYENKGLAVLTRPPRPMGEGIVTDHPENVNPEKHWKPVTYQAIAPLKGVALEGGLFKTALENNIDYLLNSFTVDELLRQFRERAGKPNPPGMRKPDEFWEEDLAGSNAGRFLMGAGNTLRWVDHAELRSRMNEVVDGIEDCRQPNGYIMAYREDTIFYSERAAYTRAWVTHGLIEAGYAGNPKALNLLRGYYNWFNHCRYLPELLRGAVQGVQGMIANTRMYFTPVGKPEDLKVVQRYFQEDYWLEELAKREDRAVWQYPYDRPHSYLITDFEAYLDLYRATGDRRYLDAMLGGWDLYHDKWEHVGGTIAICEFDEYPPKSYLLNSNTGELCGNVFWVLFNQRLHLLYPDEEKYVNEIEKSIYNVALANQVGTRGIMYHAKLVGPKEDGEGICVNTCCEGSGTRLLGSLPEYIYSIAPDGLYVDLFEPSTITWSQAGQSLRLKMATQFPFRPDVQLHFSAARPVQAKIRVRVPAWAAKGIPIQVNGTAISIGKPGSYVTLDRTWSDGDSISFTLPMDFRLTRYTGMDQIAGHERYALEYGPVLLAVIGSPDPRLEVRAGQRPEDLLKALKPKAGHPLHFTIDGDTAHEYIPYWEVEYKQSFTCYPVVDLAQSNT
ncbi:MAG: beta-L-arabinofuranosidase domain-containing protein [Terriglobia bacterium]